jgi:hypothetical protein
MTWSRRLPDVSVGSCPPEMTDVAPSMSWTSAKEPTGRAIVHFVRLSIFEWGVRLGPSARVLGLITPTLEFRFEEISSADVVRGSRPFRGPGVRFRVPDADIIAVFWTSSYLVILDKLSAHNVLVNRAETDIGFKPLDT